MAVVDHWRKVAAVVGVYLAGLIGYGQYFKAQQDPQEAEMYAQRRVDAKKRWDEAKEVSQLNGHTASATTTAAD